MRLEGLPPPVAGAGGKTEVYQNIRALRGIAVLLVLLRHVLVFAERASGRPDPFRSLLLSGDAGVDLFFAISGFVLALVTRERWQARSFLALRATRILPLYWFYTLVALGVYVCRPDLLTRLHRGMHVNVLASFLLWPQADWPLLGQGWSLVYEMYFCVVFAVLLRLPRPRLARALGWWALAVCAGCGWIALGWVGNRWPAFILAASPLTLEFIGGALVCLALQGGKLRGLAATGWFALGAGVVVLAATASLGRGFEGWARLAAYGLPAVALVYGLTLLEEEHRLLLPGALRHVGDWSYSIYLSHIFVLAILGHAWPWRGESNPWSALVLELTMVGGALFAGAASYRWIERPTLAVTRHWLMEIEAFLAAPRPRAVSSTLVAGAR